MCVYMCIVDVQIGSVWMVLLCMFTVSLCVKCVPSNIARVSIAGFHHFIGSCIAAIMVNQWYNNSRACNMYVWAEVNVTNRLDSYTIACEIHRSSVFATR